MNPLLLYLIIDSRDYSSIKSDSCDLMQAQSRARDRIARPMANDVISRFNDNLIAKEFMQLGSYSSRLVNDKYRIPHLDLTHTLRLDQVNSCQMGA